MGRSRYCQSPLFPKFNGLGNPIGLFPTGGKTHDLIWAGSPAARGRVHLCPGLAWPHLCAADFPLPGLVAPGSVPSDLMRHASGRT